MFGQGLSLTWNGEDQFRTMVGATLSWLILIMMIAYSAYRLYYMINRLNPSVGKTTLIRGADEEESF